MSISADEAVAAARAFSKTRSTSSWSEKGISTRRGFKNNQDCWIVDTPEPPAPGEPDWAFSYDGDMSYFISVDTGRCIGFGYGPNRPEHFVSDEER